MMKSGDRFDCTFEELRMDNLVVETGAGERRLPKVDIQRLETSELVPDPVWDGMLIGMGIGLVLALLTQGEVKNGGNRGALFAYALGFGAGVGYLVDNAAKHNKPEILYIAN